MSHIQSNENQIQTEYSALKMTNQPNIATSGNGVLQVLRNQWDGNGRLKFVIIALGIFISYLYVGLCQEKIMKTPYGENKEKFTYANTLVEVSLVSGLIFINSKYQFKSKIHPKNSDVSKNFTCVKIKLLLWLLSSK